MRAGEGAHAARREHGVHAARRAPVACLFVAPLAKAAGQLLLMLVGCDAGCSAASLVVPLAEAAGQVLPMRAPPRVFGPWLQRKPQHRCGVSAASPLGTVRTMPRHQTRAPAARSRRWSTQPGAARGPMCNDGGRKGRRRSIKGKSQDKLFSNAPLLLYTTSPLQPLTPAAFKPPLIRA